MANVWLDLLGTTKAFLRIGLAGPRLKASGSDLQIRNGADSADSALTTSQLHNSGDLIEINSDAADTGTDRKLTLRRNASASEALIWIFPPDDGTDGYLIRKKSGSPAGTTELEYVAPTSTNMNEAVDTTTLGFGSSSPVAMFTQSATAVIDRIQVVIDTAFNGTPSASIGIVGQTSKYAPATDIDLTQAAGTVFELHPGLPAPGSSEALIITYSAGGASAGSARFIVYYADAPA